MTRNRNSTRPRGLLSPDRAVNLLIGYLLRAGYAKTLAEMQAYLELHGLKVGRRLLGRVLRGSPDVFVNTARVWHLADEDLAEHGIGTGRKRSKPHQD